MGDSLSQHEIDTILDHAAAGDRWEKQYETIMRRLIRKAHSSLLVRRALVESLEASRSLEDYRKTNQHLTDEVRKLQSTCVKLATEWAEVVAENHRLKGGRR